MTEGYHLCAFAVDCVSIDRARVEWTVCSKGPDGRWYQWDGREIEPIETMAIQHDLPTLPEGWIEHIHDVARRSMHVHATPAFDLTEALGLHAVQPAIPSKPFPRRL